MMLRRRLLWAALCAVVVLLAAVGARADFITIGNPHNDAASDLNTTHGQSDAYGYGAVPYTYQISRTAVSIADWDLFYNDATSGRVGTFNPAYNYWNDGTRTVGTGAPAVNISFNHVAQYVNWLTTGDATDGYYSIDASGIASIPAQSHKDYADANGLTFFIPTEDEWYKAAYFKPDGSGYSLYAHGLDSDPARAMNQPGWNYNNAVPQNQTWTVGTGPEKENEEQNDTWNMMGNVWEWNEAIIGSSRGVRGGTAATSVTNLAASWRASSSPTSEDNYIGFRVASIPEPGCATMLLMGAVGLLLWRRRRTA